jgi:hypothetical protein
MLHTPVFRLNARFFLIASASANTSGNTGDSDNMTQVSATDGSGGSSDGSDPETEAYVLSFYSSPAALY